MIAGIFLLITYFLQMTSSSAKREAPQLRYQIQEESPVGTIVSNLIGDTRLRISADSSIQFRFLTDSDSMFEISSSTGVITTAVVIDREGLPACRHKVVCELSLDVVIQPNQHFQILKIIVEILDINDNAPTFRESSITLSINEAAAVGSSYIIPTATDLDSPAYAVQRYELVTPSEDFGLQVNPKLDGTLEAKLLLKTKLDRETEPRLQLKLVAFDGGAIPKTGTLIIDINVLDSNDNRPEFTRDQYDVSILENLPTGTVVIQVKAIDRDFGPNGLVGYSFAQQTQNLHGSIFGIRNASGEIFVRGNVDHEKSSVFQLIVIGQDHGPDLLSSEVTVVVHVEDQNDNAPTITIHTLSEGGAPVAEISEDSAVGAFVAHVTVTDPDSGLNGWVNCTLNEKVFALVRQYSNEYRIETAATLDRERTEQYALNIRCQDGGKVPRVSDKNLRVIVTDVNDCPPMFSQQTYKATLTENNYVGVTVLQVSATDWDADDNSKIVYSIPGNVNALFHVDQRGVVSAHAAIDREQYDTFRFPIMAIDGGSPPKTGSALVVISIEDVNDEKPTFSRSNFVMNVSENEPAGSMVGIVTATDKDGPLYNVFRFSFLSGSTVTDTFGIDPVTGAIITQHQLDREKQDLYRFVIQVRDQKSPNFSDTASVSVNVIDKNDNTPTFVYPTPSNISVSNQLPIGTSVASVTARDADTGENSRLAFKIVETRDNNGTFRIDPETGNVYTGRRLNGIDYRIYPISVTVSDHGSPPRSASTVIFIHVNQSIPFVGSQNGDDVSDNFSSEYHVVLVVAMVSGCSVITVILIVAVVIVRQKEKERRIRKYNCRVEALRMLTTKDNNASGSTPEGSPYKKLQNGGNGTLLTNVDAVDNEVSRHYYGWTAYELHAYKTYAWLLGSDVTTGWDIWISTPMNI